MARKSQYTEDTVAAILDALRSGETDELSARMGGISKTTYYEWINTKPEFNDAVKRAKKEYEQWLLGDILQDAKRSLKTLILGTEYEEVKIEYEQDPFNPKSPRIKKQITTRKKVLPNVTAVIFALTNRDPEHWQNKINGELNQKVEVEDKPNISLANVPDDLLEQIIKIINQK